MNEMYHQAISAYKTSNEGAMSGYEIMLELYKGFLNNLREAKKAFQEKRFEDVVEIKSKTYDILKALQSHLDHENDGAAASELDRFYTKTFGKLSAISRQEDQEAAYDEILEDVKKVYEIFSKNRPGTQPQES